MAKERRATGSRRASPLHRGRRAARATEHHPVQSDSQLAAYYARRAPEIEEAYRIIDRLPDFAILHMELPQLVDGRDVLEVACGTGYWTRIMARTARSITAIDINEEMLALARAKELAAGRVEFLRHDVWKLGELEAACNAAVALFWWSHIPHYRIRTFLGDLNALLPPGSPVILVDNLPDDSCRTPEVGVDADGNSYQRRRLRTGETFEIIKNYPLEEELRTVLAGFAERVSYTALRCLWLLSYRTRGTA